MLSSATLARGKLQQQKIDGLFSICSRWHLIASTIETDGSFSEMKNKIINGLKEQGVDWADAQETPFHESIDALKQIIGQCRRRTLQAKEEEKNFCLRLFYIWMT